MSIAKIIAVKDNIAFQKRINPHALDVLFRLQKAGYKAYLVGGSVRDLLLDIKPKDFDIATNATPEQIKKVFHSCLLIGRRFRLAHIRYGQDIIEVATFRADPNHHEDESEKKEAISTQGLILRDNVYGTIEEDAFRRDFTINALYFDSKQATIIDYCNGLKDIQAKQLKMIGDPKTRYQEDPVRLLRVVRLSAKLNFNIEKNTATFLNKLGHLLSQVPPARLFEEMIKLFLKGHAEKTFALLLKYRLLKAIFPDSYNALIKAVYAEYPVRNFFTIAMQNSDQRVLASKSLNPAFILAVLLWYTFKIKFEQAINNGLPKLLAIDQAFHEVLKKQKNHISIPKRLSITIRNIFCLQYWFERSSQRLVLKTLEHPCFRAGYDFLLLRAKAGENIQTVANWWQHFYGADQSTQATLLKNLSVTKRQKIG